jgi:DNA-binding NtrC family response regulator
MTRILIVEDEPTVRGLLCEILGHTHECLAVRSAEEGLAMLGVSDQTFDVVITDVKLPGMDGEEFLKTVHERVPGLPVIVMSGGYGGDESRFLEAGAFGYLLKPFRFEEVEEMVGRALRSRE